jgi:hypothetical protein
MITYSVKLVDKNSNKPINDKTYFLEISEEDINDYILESNNSGTKKQAIKLFKKDFERMRIALLDINILKKNQIKAIFKLLK